MTVVGEILRFYDPGQQYGTVIGWKLAFLNVPGLNFQAVGLLQPITAPYFQVVGLLQPITAPYFTLISKARKFA
jgi:hypothetical protein